MRQTKILVEEDLPRQKSVYIERYSHDREATANILTQRSGSSTSPIAGLDDRLPKVGGEKRSSRDGSTVANDRCNRGIEIRESFVLL